jgi:hypothetical protein
VAKVDEGDVDGLLRQVCLVDAISQRGRSSFIHQPQAIDACNLSHAESQISSSWSANASSFPAQRQCLGALAAKPAAALATSTFKPLPPYAGVG